MKSLSSAKARDKYGFPLVLILCSCGTFSVLFLCYGYIVWIFNATVKAKKQKIIELDLILLLNFF